MATITLTTLPGSPQPSTSKTTSHLEQPGLFPSPERAPDLGTSSDVAPTLPRLISAYSCLAVIYFISSLDINSVALGLPTISRDLEAGSSITWTRIAYLMGQASIQALYGRLSDILGRKPVLLACVGFLILGDVLCSLPRNPRWLYACRALSGVGGGGISSLISIIVSDLVSLEDRGKYQGMLSGAIRLGSSAGPFMAASLLQKRDRAGTESWRWIFFMPPIVASVCVAAVIVALPLKPVVGSWREKLRQVDWMGLAAALVGMFCILIPIHLGGTIWPWRSSAVISMMAVGGVAVIAFIMLERFARIPMIPLRLFTQRPIAILLVQSGLYNLVWQVDLYFVPAYFQDIRGYGTLQAAVLMLPMLLVQSMFGVVSGPLMTKFEGYGLLLHPGMALWLLGVCLKMIYTRTTSVSVYVISMFVEGWGIGFVFQPALVALQALCQPQDRAVATSTRNLFRMFGSVIGMTIATALQFAVTQTALPSDLPASLRSQVTAGTWQPGQDETGVWDTVIFEAKMKGFRSVFAMEIPMMALCVVGCLCVPNALLNGDTITEGHRRQGGANE